MCSAYAVFVVIHTKASICNEPWKFTHNTQLVVEHGSAVPGPSRATDVSYEVMRSAIVSREVSHPATVWHEVTSPPVPVSYEVTDSVVSVSQERSQRRGRAPPVDCFDGESTDFFLKTRYWHYSEQQSGKVDARHYLLLNEDPTTTFTNEVNRILFNMKTTNSINEHTYKYLHSTNTQPARFYLLPKIHKPGNPGRPIISSIEAPTEKISQFVDFHLRPLGEMITSYVKDTSKKSILLALSLSTPY